ncbi:MAG: DUF3987 domain-containing protein [Candidatus Tectomicrobia bacterium]|uniref:DUF3987 domain-containing protein n=1 Tax=Tectimicrobiota bacterium TaxID=2528274 RepID=A0A933GJI2_UNCTE|nr:DUF3987 domain-containing protein [Candidatus Tectomicrobia bacterium]
MVLRFLKELEGQFLNETITVSDLKDLSGPTVTDQALLSVISFPFGVLPLQFREEIDLLASAKGVEPEFVASCMLTILSGALGNTVRIMAKNGHVVSPFCWFFFVAESGYGKSPTMNELFKIIREREAQASKKFSAEWQEYQRELLKARDEKSNYFPPKPLRAEFFVTDYTVESLADFFENNSRGGISYQDEIAGVIKGLNQYKGKGNDREHHLTLFNNQAWKINRRSGVRFICNTGIAVIGGIQPKKMTETFQVDSFDDGLLSRFLIFNAREQNSSYSRQEVDSLPFWDSFITAAYDQVLRMDSQGFADPEIFSFDDKAQNNYGAFFNELQQLKPFLSDRGRVFIPKLVGYYTLKFAGILHFITVTALSERQMMYDVIELTTLKGAIELTRYFASQAMTTIKLYDPSAPKLNEFQRRLIETLSGLKEEVKNGKLALTRIAEAYNTGLPPRAHHSHKMLGTLLRQLQLTTIMSTGGRYFLK